MWCRCWVSSLCVRARLWGTRVLCALSTQPQRKSHRVSLPVAAMLVSICASLSLRLTCSYTQLLTATQCCSSWISAKCCFQSVNAVLSAHSLPSSTLTLFSFDWIRRTSCQVASHWSSSASLQLWHHTVSHEPSIPVQIQLIALHREAQIKKTHYYRQKVLEMDNALC